LITTSAVDLSDYNITTGQDVSSEVEWNNTRKVLQAFADANATDKIVVLPGYAAVSLMPF